MQMILAILGIVGPHHIVEARMNQVCMHTLYSLQGKDFFVYSGLQVKWIFLHVKWILQYFGRPPSQVAGIGPPGILL